MSLPEIASIITIADFSGRIVSYLKKKKKKRKTVSPKRKTVSPKRKQTKEQELITKLLTNPEGALKEIGAEYLVKNRKRIIRNIEKRVVDEFLE